MAAPTTLQVEEYQFGDTGIVLNSDVTLPFVDILSIDGVDSADTRLQTHDREGTDGGYVDAEFQTFRTITIEGNIYTNPTASETYLDDLKANFAPSRAAKPFYIRTDAGLRFCYAKSTGLRYRKDAQRRLGVYDFQVQLLCEDPRFYDTVPIVGGPASLESVVTDGRTYPKTYPVLYGAAASSNGIQVSLGGNRLTPAILTITGPVVVPSIIYDNTGTTMTFNLALGVDDYLEINLANRSVRLNGSASRRSLMVLTGTWYLLEPGVNNFRFFGTQTPPAPLATLEISAYSAWL